MKNCNVLPPAYRSQRDRDAQVAPPVQGIEASFLPGGSTICKMGCKLLPEGVGRTVCETACNLL
jgi:hypothetical protein